MPSPVIPTSWRYARLMSSAGTAAKDSLVQNPSRATKLASHSWTQCALLPLSERAVASQLVQFSALVEKQAETAGLTVQGNVAVEDVEEQIVVGGAGVQVDDAAGICVRAL